MRQAITLATKPDGTTSVVFGIGIPADKQIREFDSYKPREGVSQLILTITGRDAWKVRWFDVEDAEPKHAEHKKTSAK